MAFSDEVYSDFEEVVGAEADEGGAFVTLRPGVYAFSIDEPVKRERYPGGNKIPACWKAVVTLKIDGREQGTTKAIYNLFLVKRLSWRIKELFVGTGIVKPDAEKFQMAWNKLVGTTGVVRVGNREYDNKTYNEIVSILPPNKADEELAKAMLAEPQQESFSGFPG